MQSTPKKQALNVDLSLGDITRTKADAIVVPQFPKGSSPLGVGAALYRAGFGVAIEAYNSEIAANGPRRDGSSFFAKNPNGPALLHTTVINDESHTQLQFARVRTGFYSALQEAEKNGIGSIAAPALGTSNGLTAEDSANAMLGAVAQYIEDGGKPPKVTIVIYNDQTMLNKFRDVLNSGPHSPKGIGDPLASGVRELSPDVRGFLYGFFTQAALAFKSSVKQVEPGLVEVVPAPKGSLAAAFQSAAKTIRNGTLRQVNEAITCVVEKAANIASLDDHDALDTVVLQQRLFYNNQVKDNSTLRHALGSYFQGVI